jgi:hypothetical protein
MVFKGGPIPFVFPSSRIQEGVSDFSDPLITVHLFHTPQSLKSKGFQTPWTGSFCRMTPFSMWDLPLLPLAKPAGGESIWIRCSGGDIFPTEIAILKSRIHLDSKMFFSPKRGGDWPSPLGQGEKD